MSWPNVSCANCRADLPDRGYRLRPVPRLGARRRQLCEACADLDLIAGQGQLFDPAPEHARPAGSTDGYGDPPDRLAASERAA